MLESAYDEPQTCSNLYRLTESPLHQHALHLLRKQGEILR